MSLKLLKFMIFGKFVGVLVFLLSWVLIFLSVLMVLWLLV